jgi:short-subunit dehydrogenase involved in D-alanine esterification of teichoic acids
MFKRLKQFFKVVRTFDADILNLHRRIAALEDLVAHHTDINVDVNYAGLSHVIVMGRYRNNDYVQTFAVNEQDLNGLIDRLKQMERYGTVNRIDSPPMFQAIFKREFDV